MNEGGKMKRRLNSLFSFTPRERRGVLWLLPLLAIVAVILAFANRPRFEKSFLDVADIEAEAGDEYYRVSASGAAARESPEEGPAPGLFVFDPNTVTLQELVALGFDARTAAGIIRYREGGKVFRIAEDFATCYGVSIEDYTRLEPYIIIGERFRPQSGGQSRNERASASESGSLPDPQPFDPNTLTAAGFRQLGFSAAQAETIIRFRESIGGFGSAADFARCYVVSEDNFRRLEPFIIIERQDKRDAPPAESVVVELNTADSAALRSVSGIGEVTVMRIIDYRQRLGGFARAEQLAEVQGMTEANYERIVQQISVDSCEIQKIDINFATHKNLVETLGEHPYMTDGVLRKILKERQLEGGWSSIGDMVEQNIMTQRQAERLAPYLIFRNE